MKRFILEIRDELREPLVDYFNGSSMVKMEQKWGRDLAIEATAMGRKFVREIESGTQNCCIQQCTCMS